jgi:hypothetical protein
MNLYFRDTLGLLESNMPRCGGSGASDAANALARQQNAAIESGMGQVDEAFKGYNPEWFNKYYDANIKAGTPALNQQYARQKEQLGFNLANKGQFNSMAGQKLGTSLANELTTQRQNLSDRASAATSTLEQQVANYKNQVIGQIESASAPLTAAQGGVSTASMFQSPSLMPAVNNAFGQWANTFLAANVGGNMGGGGQLAPSGGFQSDAFNQPGVEVGSAYTVNSGN